MAAQPDPELTFTPYELEVLAAVCTSLLGCSFLADHGVTVSEVHLSGASPDTTIVVVWTDSKRRNKIFTESWGLYDGGYPDGVPGITTLTPPGTIASVIFSNVLD